MQAIKIQRSTFAGVSLLLISGKPSKIQGLLIPEISDWEIQAVANSPSPPVPHTAAAQPQPLHRKALLLAVGPRLSPLHPPAVTGWIDFGKQPLLCFAWQPATLRAEGRCMHRSQHHWREGKELQLKSTSIDQLQSFSLYLSI